MSGTVVPDEIKKSASMELVKLMLEPYDELVEVDTFHGRMRALHHTEGKYFVPIIDSSVRDLAKYSVEYMIHPEDRDAYIAATDMETLPKRLAESETPGVIRARFRYRLLSGGWRLVEQVTVGGANQGLPDGLYYTFIFDLEDTPAREGPEAPPELRSELTGLMWEESFFAHARELIRKHPEGWCMIAIDLEHFKLFNEWYGRKQGDLLLAEIGGRLGKAAEETGGLACYYGQDDFVLLVPENAEWISGLYDELHRLVTEHGASVGFMPAFGITPMSAVDQVEDVYDRAALASHRAKESYHDRICTYDPALFKQTEREYQILSDFQQALEEHELFIVLQPQCVISTGRVVGAESLVRWRREDGEMISPGIFVPVLEEYGFVTELDKYVWEEVCAWQKRWIDGGHTPLPVSVNVSQIDIFTIDVPDYLEQLLKKYSLSPEVVKVEITESAYVDNDSVVDAVQRLRDKGFLVLMDDFGSGYSSLNMLRSLNVDVIKLDAQFLRMNKGDRKGIQIIESIVDMAKTMGMPIIVEGVETQEEIEFLSSLGCSYVQGYYFYRPMPARDFEKLISAPEKIDTAGFRFKAKNQFHAREFLDQNLFSDAMLNNILGPVAFVSRSGDSVDITRCNRQFFDAMDTRGFTGITKNVEKYVPEEERARIFELLDTAEREPLTGAVGVLPFIRSTGELQRFEIRIYFMEEDESGKKFYVSVRNLGGMVSLSDRMRLLSESAADSVAFMTRGADGWIYRLVLHGLEHDLGLSREAMEEELRDGSFLKHTPPGTAEAFRALADETGTSGIRREDEPPMEFRFTTDDGRVLTLLLWCYHVRDRAGGVEYALLLRKKDD
ncbi:MAG: EAL domain-containing protein [Oscillospiraceae bacterium]|nr:EAL domain-containing protein [Oscillospiraceae bacterium]